MANNVMNIINFVRGCEPRRPKDLYTPVEQEIAINRENGIKSTFLLQYDALLRLDFQELFLREQGEDMELGLWFEMCRPLTEAVGIEWRGRPGFDWDWYVDPGFLPSYTPEQREKLIDEVFTKFYSIFGYYPSVAGSWILDAHSMEYMSKKYDMDAFCICREQLAVDAYTLWGGYYSGGYYPSRNNMLCPAQSDRTKINTPVFRMLGIDPIYGYDEAKHMPSIGGCYTMEPCWPCGKDEKVMEWYFRSYYDNPSLAMSHATTGQENSFGWDRIEEGYRLQIKLAKEYIAAGKLRIETLGQTGADFKKQYEVTPSSALSALDDWSENGLQSIWYSCVNYRANLFNENGKLYFRDMQQFDDTITEQFHDTACRQWQATYENLPMIDNRQWSEENRLAALTFLDSIAQIEETSETADQKLHAAIRFRDGHEGSIYFDDSRIVIENCGSLCWSFGSGQVFQSIDHQKICFKYLGVDYTVRIVGVVQQKNDEIYIHPIDNMVEIVLCKSEH